jgi:hypothetical protein
MIAAAASQPHWAQHLQQHMEHPIWLTMRNLAPTLEPCSCSGLHHADVTVSMECTTSWSELAHAAAVVMLTSA